MHKQLIKRVMEEKLKEGTKVIYSNSDNPTLMEEVEVVSVDKKEGVATLSNKVKVCLLYTSPSPRD